MIADLAATLRDEARWTNERRLLVLAGGRDACLAAARDVLDGAAVAADETTLVTTCEAADRSAANASPRRTPTCCSEPPASASCSIATTSAGRTRSGGRWARSMAAGWSCCSPHRSTTGLSDATPSTRRSRCHRSTRATSARGSKPVSSRRSVHTAVSPSWTSIPALIERDGRTDPPPHLSRPAPSLPTESEFPRAAYEACLTADQVECLAAFEGLTPGNALVVEADRGRGNRAPPVSRRGRSPQRDSGCS